MRLNEMLERVPVGGTFYRESKPDVLYERIGTLIERDGLGWARLEGNNRDYGWTMAYHYLSGYSPTKTKPASFAAHHLRFLRNRLLNLDDLNLQHIGKHTVPLVVS